MPRGAELGTLGQMVSTGSPGCCLSSPHLLITPFLTKSSPDPALPGTSWVYILECSRKSGL